MDEKHISRGTTANFRKDIENYLIYHNKENVSALKPAPSIENLSQNNNEKPQNANEVKKY